MMKTINFDDRCTNWSINAVFNEAYITHQIDYIRDIIRIQGYVYLEEIYKLFGAGWDPHESNDVMIYGENDPRFVCSALGGGNYKISIYY